MASPLSLSADHAFGKKEKARTDFEAGALGRLQVDIEPNLVVLDTEADHAALLDKIVGLPNGENRGVLKSGEDGGNVLFIIGVEKQDVTNAQIVPVLYVDDLDGVRTNLLASDHGFQIARSSGLSEDTEIEGPVVRAEGFGRPVNKLCKMVEKGGLDAILIGGGLSRGWKREA